MKFISAVLLSASASSVGAFAPALKANPSSDAIVMNNVGSKWAYDPFGATHQENFLYKRDPNSDAYAEDKWYYQPWSFVSQPQFIPLEKTGVDMWYFEPRSVIPADDEFFHGYNSASHMWVPDQIYAEPQPFSAPAPAAPALEASQQGAVPPMPAASAPQQQAMPAPTPQAMPEMDTAMDAYNKAMAGN